MPRLYHRNNHGQQPVSPHHEPRHVSAAAPAETSGSCSAGYACRWIDGGGIDPSAVATASEAGDGADGRRGNAAESRSIEAMKSGQIPDNIEIEWLEMVAGDGIEPPTRGFSIPCSTN
jgi:hypothetical protein